MRREGETEGGRKTRWNEPHKGEGEREEEEGHEPVRMSHIRSGADREGGPVGATIIAIAHSGLPGAKGLQGGQMKIKPRWRGT